MAWKKPPREIVLPTSPDEWADVYQVALGMKCSRATVYREINASRFQRPIKQRGKSVWRWGWVIDYKRRLEEESRHQNEKAPAGEGGGGWEA
jgi:predicted DNA-binding transcriptional regulator AlpA